MSRTLFRSKNVEPDRPIPIYSVRQLQDRADFSHVSRSLVQMPTGLEKEEEAESHLQAAMRAQAQFGETREIVIPVPDFSRVLPIVHPRRFKPPRSYIRQDLESDVHARYDIDSEDEKFIAALNPTARSLPDVQNDENNDKKQIITVDVDLFEKLIEKFETFQRACAQPLEPNHIISHIISTINIPNEIVAKIFEHWSSKRACLNPNYSLIPQIKTEQNNALKTHDPYVAFRKRFEKMQTRKNRKVEEAYFEKLFTSYLNLINLNRILRETAEREDLNTRIIKLQRNILNMRIKTDSDSTLMNWILRNGDLKNLEIIGISGQFETARNVSLRDSAWKTIFEEKPVRFKILSLYLEFKKLKISQGYKFRNEKIGIGRRITENIQINYNQQITQNIIKESVPEDKNDEKQQNNDQNIVKNEENSNLPNNPDVKKDEDPTNDKISNELNYPKTEDKNINNNKIEIIENNNIENISNVDKNVINVDIIDDKITQENNDKNLILISNKDSDKEHNQNNGEIDDKNNKEIINNISENISNKIDQDEINKIITENVENPDKNLNENQSDEQNKINMDQNENEIKNNIDKISNGNNEIVNDNEINVENNQNNILDDSVNNSINIINTEIKSNSITNIDDNSKFKIARAEIIFEDDKVKNYDKDDTQDIYNGNISTTENQTIPLNNKSITESLIEPPISTENTTISHTKPTEPIKPTFSTNLNESKVGRPRKHYHPSISNDEPTGGLGRAPRKRIKLISSEDAQNSENNINSESGDRNGDKNNEKSNDKPNITKKSQNSVDSSVFYKDSTDSNDFSTNLPPINDNSNISSKPASKSHTKSNLKSSTKSQQKSQSESIQESITELINEVIIEDQSKISFENVPTTGQGSSSKSEKPTKISRSTLPRNIIENLSPKDEVQASPKHSRKDSEGKLTENINTESKQQENKSKVKQ